MSDDLKFVLGLFGLDDESEHASGFLEDRDRLARSYVEQGLSEVRAKEVATFYLAGYLTPGPTWGELDAEKIKQLIERTFYTFQKERIVIDIEQESDVFGLQLRVLATDADAADQLSQMAEAIQQRKVKGEPS